VAGSYQNHRAQIEAILISWGTGAEAAERAAEVMAWADLHGIDSHGLSTLTVYHQRWKNGRINMAATPRIVRESPVSTLIDGDGGLGHPTSRWAMEIAIAKAKNSGMAISSVRNSTHFGACGFYTEMAANADLIGLVTTSTSHIQVAPAGGREARLGTEPISFSAPGLDGEPFLLDMATTTAASGKIRNRFNEGLPVPVGWLVTSEGQPSTDPLEAAQKGGSLTPLGGTPEGSYHKGYGLAVMVDILSSCLSGSTLMTSPMHLKQPYGQDISHFFLAIDPGLFRDVGEFRADVANLCGALRATAPVDPERPVMIAGDPERKKARERMRTGIPIGPGLLAKIRAIAREHEVPWMLDGDGD
jgi:LDH2 family malate/lactate/ureidoglycolate dehydrogenase